MKKLLFLLVAVLVPSLLMVGCGDDLTTKKVDVDDVSLGQFELTNPSPVGASELSGAAMAEPTTEGNPSCGTTSLDDLLSENSAWDDIAKRIKEVKIDKVRYRVTNNNTPVDITGQLKLTIPNSNIEDIKIVAKGTIPAGPVSGTPEWTELLFDEQNDGKAIVNHYLNERGETFKYCVASDYDGSDLDLTIEILLDLDVVVKIL